MSAPTAGPFKVAMTLIAGVLIFALLASFGHMIDWTKDATQQSTWLGVANAVISELMPTVSFIVLKLRQDSGRSVRLPVVTLIGSIALSLCAQESATGLRLPYDSQLLAGLPAIAALVLSIMGHAEIEHRRHVKAAADLAAEQAADLARLDAEQAAEQAAERVRLAAEQRAELQRQDAEQAQVRAEQRAELQRQERIRLAEIDAAAKTESERLAAAERAEQRRVAADKQARAEQAQAAREAEAARITAQADAEERRIRAEAQAALVRAQASQAEAEAQAKKAALATMAKRQQEQEAEKNDKPDATAAPRMSRVERTRLVETVLASLPAGTTRDQAVKAVADKMTVTERYARDFVPEGWVAPSSATHGHLRAVASA